MSRPFTSVLYFLSFVLQLGGHAFVITLSSPHPLSIMRTQYRHGSSGDDVRLHLSSRSEDDLREEARQLRDQAQALRKQVEEFESSSSSSSSSSIKKKAAPNLAVDTLSSSPWSLPTSASAAASEEEETKEKEASGGVEGIVEYRLYVDIGREPGTWMDPRWGASGRRIEFTLDIRFFTSTANDNDEEAMVDPLYQQVMIQENIGGTKSRIRKVETAPFARLRSGFDRMKCLGGAYRIDTARKTGDGTVRILLKVEGTNDYGDVTIPEGFLYFSLPAFNQNISLLSSKPGPVTVRQVGWNTGWRREESRIVGVFRAVALQTARRRDGY